MTERPGLQEVQAALERDPLVAFSPLGMLARRQPAVVAVESVEPLHALLVFEPPRPQTPYLVWLWGQEASVCRSLLSALQGGSTYWLTTPDRQAAETAKAWAAATGYEGSYARYTVRPEAFRPAPHARLRIRELTPADAPALAVARPKISQLLTKGPREPSRVFGVVEDGAWQGDVFCAPAYKDVWIIGDLFVPEEHRRRGIGRALVTACTEYVLRSSGRPTYDAHVENEPSRRTVEALGYRSVGGYHELELTAR